MVYRPHHEGIEDTGEAAPQQDIEQNIETDHLGARSAINERMKEVFGDDGDEINPDEQVRFS